MAASRGKGGPVPQRYSSGRLLVFSILVALTLPANADIQPIDAGRGCDPASACSGACGTIHDGSCTYVCGSCASGQTCTNNVCVTPCSPTTSCAAQGKNCGTVFDGCNTVACGTCQSGWSCSASQV